MKKGYYFSLASAGLLVTSIAAHAFTGQEYSKDAKISLKQACVSALKAHPGKITDEELEREAGVAGFVTRSTLRPNRAHRKSEWTRKRGRSSKTAGKDRTRTETGASGRTFTHCTAGHCRKRNHSDRSDAGVSFWIAIVSSPVVPDRGAGAHHGA